MKIYRFRILLDNANNVFRDIEISADDTFLSLHGYILKAFAFSGKEMASFYLSNEEWDKGEEIALMDFSEPGQSVVHSMTDTYLNDMLFEAGEKVLYLYDFLRMWIWYVELVEVSDAVKAITYPRIVLAVGDSPKETDKGMVQSFQSHPDDDEFSDFEDDFDEDDFEGMGTFDDDNL
jgi:hypothetical protein